VSFKIIVKDYNMGLVSSVYLCYNLLDMSKVCEICGKSTVAGNRIQHKHSIGWKYKAPKSKRTFKPNLRRIEVEIEGSDVPVRVSSCMKCYKKLRKEQE
jgi:large subunit ribosomal protein L28